MPEAAAPVSLSLSHTPLAPGARVEIRGVEWIVRRVDATSTGGHSVAVTGVSELVRGREARFLTEIEGKGIVVLDPAEARLVGDESPQYRDTRLYLEALLRQSPPTTSDVWIGHKAAIDVLPFQLEPALAALDRPRQRILMADAVGLGKTVEVGVLLAELIKRGKGKRILVVCGRSMMTQRQKALWSRFTREAVWPVFREYRSQLTERGKREYIDMIRDARQLIEKQGIRLPYKAVVVDEAQDLSAEAFRLIRALVPPGPNDIFLVGDAHQRIYRYRATLGKCGIDIRGRARKLRLNYRTTDEIRRFAVALLEGRPIDDLDGGLDDQLGYMSLTHGPKVEVHRLKTLPDEAAFLGRHVKELIESGAAPESICIVGRTKHVVEHVKDALRSASLGLYEVKREATDNRSRPGVRVATMHRVKGLEFDHVLVASANEKAIPLEKALKAGDDVVAARNAETGERALLYVALTRAKRSAAVSGWGAMSPFL